jgi:hypothetical protein
VFTDPLLRNGFFYYCKLVHYRSNPFTELLCSNEKFRFSSIVSQCFLLKVIRPVWTRGAPPFLIFSRAVLMTSVLGSTFVLVARFFPLCSLCKSSRCSLLKSARPERFPHRVSVSPGVLSSSSGWCGQNFRE